jgi:hypothetical protein
MRLSVRRAVKLAAAVVFLLFLNVLVGHNLSIASFDNSEKVLGHRVRDNGRKPLDGAPQAEHDVGSHDGALQRQQRSAKLFSYSSSSVLLEPLKPPVASKRTTLSTVVQKSVLPSNGTQGTELSHGHQSTSLQDVFISVKTSGKFHASRLQLLLQTWYLLAREQVSFKSL